MFVRCHNSIAAKLFAIVCGLAGVPQHAAATTAAADKINAQFEQLAQKAVSNHLGSLQQVCPLEVVRSKRRPRAGVGWTIDYSCRRKADDGSRKYYSMQVQVGIVAFTHDHPTIGIRHRPDFMQDREQRGGSNGMDSRRTRWFDRPTYVARSDERIIDRGNPNRTDTHSASITADGKRGYRGVRHDDEHRPDSEAVSFRVTVEVKIDHDKLRSLATTADQAALSIANEIWNGLSGQRDVCDRVANLQLSFAAKDLLKFLCQNDLVISTTFNRPVLRLASYIKDEDGTVPGIRTGYEVEVYRELKRRLLAPRSGEKKLHPSSLFWLTVRVMDKVNRARGGERRMPVIAFEAMLTAHNVTRLLARPEQWVATYPYNAYGGDRTIVDTEVAPMLEDLLGIQSIDSGPSFYSAKALRQREHAPICRNFFDGQGPYYFHWTAKRATNAEKDGFNYPYHYNGGIHYYFWVGAIVKNVATEAGLGSTQFGSVGQWATYLFEDLQKRYSTRNPTRGRIQLDYGFTKGAEWWDQFQGLLANLREQAPARVRP